MRLHLGGWEPGRTNALLLLLQVGFTIQAASRGMDYVLPSPPRPTPRVLTEIEAALPLWVWGVGFLLAAGLIVISLSGGWWPSMVIGHGGLFSLYMAFAFGMLQAAPGANWWLAVPGALVLGVGLFLVLTRWPSRNWLRFALSMVTVAVGGWVCAFGLGFDFRTATGLLIAGIGHLGMAVGVVWVRSVAPGRAIQG